MKSTKRFAIFSIFALAIFVVSLIHPSMARADEGTPPPDVPAVVESNAAQSDANAAPVESVPADDAPVEAAATNAAPVDSAPTDTAPEDVASPAEAIPTDAAPTDSATTDTAPNDVASPAEAIPTDAAPTDSATTEIAPLVQSLPADTSLVVVGSDGQSEAMASQEAAQIITSGDPYFLDGTKWVGYSASSSCPPPVLPIDCNTGLSNPIQAAVDAFQASATAFGEIFVESGTYNENVTIDGTATGVVANPAGLIGAGSSTTTINGYLHATNVHGFTLQGFTFIGDVRITSDGAVVVSDVNITNSPGIGLYLGATGDINVDRTISKKNKNQGALLISGSGTINVTNSEFSDNDEGEGASIFAEAVTIANSAFQGNGKDGLNVYTWDGDIILNGVTAAANGYKNVYGNNYGAYLSNLRNVSIANSGFSNNTGEGLLVKTDGDVTISGITGNNNGYSGLNVYTSDGAITLNGVTAAANGYESEEGDNYGAYLNNLRNVSIANSSFSNNAGEGLFVDTVYGDVTISGITGNNNGYENEYGDNNGAILFSVNGNIFVTDSAFNYNAGAGLAVVTGGGKVNISNVDAVGNSHQGMAILADPEINTNVTVQCSSILNNALGLAIINLSGQTTLLGNTIQNNILIDQEIIGPFSNGTMDCLPLSAPPPASLELKAPPFKKVLGGFSGLSCEGLSGFVFDLPNGNRVVLYCQFNGQSGIAFTLKTSNLPGPLTQGSLVSALTFEAFDFDGRPLHGLQSGANISFALPNNGDEHNNFMIVFWDNNQQEWVPVGGGNNGNGRLDAIVYKPGTYALVQQ